MRAPTDRILHSNRQCSFSAAGIFTTAQTRVSQDRQAISSHPAVCKIKLIRRRKYKVPVLLNIRRDPSTAIQQLPREVRFNDFHNNMRRNSNTLDHRPGTELTEVSHIHRN